MTGTHDDQGRPPFDEELAASYVGKYILVGITYLDHEGNELRAEQRHGVIASATQEGIEISLRGAHEGQTFNLPPDLGAMFPADPGSYTLHSTNEVVENPDFVGTWEIHQPPPNPESQK